MRCREPEGTWQWESAHKAHWHGVSRRRYQRWTSIQYPSHFETHWWHITTRCKLHLKKCILEPSQCYSISQRSPWKAVHLFQLFCHWMHILEPDLLELKFIILCHVLKQLLLCLKINLAWVFNFIHNLSYFTKNMYQSFLKI